MSAVVIDLNDVAPVRAERPRFDLDADRRAAARHRGDLGAAALPERAAPRRRMAARQHPAATRRATPAPASSRSGARMPATGSTSTATRAAGRSAPSSRRPASPATTLIAEAAEIAGVAPGAPPRQAAALAAGAAARPGAGDRAHPGARACRPPARRPSATSPAAAWSLPGRRRPAVPSRPDPLGEQVGLPGADRRGARPRRRDHRPAPDLPRKRPSGAGRQGGRREAADDARPRGRRRCPARRRRSRARRSALCEGIETGLAAMTARPGPAGLGHALDLRARAGARCRRRRPASSILADHDASGAGLRAAETAARRLRSEGREVVDRHAAARGRRLQRPAAARGARGGRAGDRGGRDATGGRGRRCRSASTGR